MGVFEAFPYANQQNLNLDWVLSIVRKMEDALNSSFTEYITQWVEDNYNSLLLDAVYNKESETITFSKNTAQMSARDVALDYVKRFEMLGDFIYCKDEQAREKVARVSLAENTRVNLADLYPDIMTDPTDNSIVEALKYAAQNGLRCYLPNIKFSLTATHEIKIPDGKKLDLLCYGTIFDRVNHDNQMESYSLRFTGNDVAIEGAVFSFTGITPSWSETVVDQLRFGTALLCDCKRISVKNCEFVDVYGYPIKIRGFNSANVEHCYFHNIGGRWSSYGFGDGFGDGIYIENSILNSICNIRDNYINAYAVTEETRTSRCGVTVEYNAKGIINIDNCYIKNFMRGIHIEVSEDVVVNINGCLFDRYTVGVFGSTTIKQLNIDNCRFINGDAYDAMGIYFPVGMSTEENSTNLVMSNCYAEFNDNTKTVLDINKAVFENCTFVSNGKYTEFYNCRATFKNCEFRNRAFFNNCFDIVIDGCLFNETGSAVSALLAAEKVERMQIAGSEFVNTRWYLSNCKIAIADKNTHKISITGQTNCADIVSSYLLTDSAYIVASSKLLPYFNYNSTSTIVETGEYIYNVDGTVSQ